MSMISNNDIASDANIEQSKVMGLIDIQTNVTKIVNDVIPTLKNKISELETKLQEANETIEKLSNKKQDAHKLGKLAVRDFISLNEVGLDKVDNTSDIDKPISNATAVALNLKVDRRDLGKIAFKNKITKADVELDKVDNTSDLDKPVSDAVAKALENKVDYSAFSMIKTFFNKLSIPGNECIDISTQTNLKNVVARILVKLGADSSHIRM